MSRQDYLSLRDIDQLKHIVVTVRSIGGDLMAMTEEHNKKKLENLNKSLKTTITNYQGLDRKNVASFEKTLNLVEPNRDGSVDYNAIFRLCHEIKSQVAKAIETFFRTSFLERNGRKKLSARLSEYLWPSDEGDTQVEFRSPVPGFPPCGELIAVCSNMRGSGQRKRAGKYCLAACRDGTVQWLHESECKDGNHIWTLHLFEHRVGEVLRLRDELQRTQPNVYNNCVINYIGRNVNGSGTQTIGTVYCH